MLLWNECAMFVFTVCLTLGVASAVRHSAAYTVNQQINCKAGKGKKKNDIQITLNRPTAGEPSRVQIFIHLKN